MKKHFEVLEGLRGVAAFVVLVFHYCEVVYYPDYETIPIGHGFLAVDFFFCLSGFIIAFAYSDRIKHIGIKQFMINRLIRLHPLVVFGIVLGLISYLINPYIKISGQIFQMIIAFFCSIFLIPYTKLQYREGELFPYNTPLWSLLFEYIANIIFAFVLCRLRKAFLLLVGALCALWLVFCAQRSGWIINGWNVVHWSDGLARVGFSFIAGMILYQLNWIWKNKTGIWIMLLLGGVLAFPHFENDWIVECVIVIVCFPLIVSLGAGTSVQEAGKKICLFLGKMSYPLYVTHFVTVSLFGSYFFQHESKPEGIYMLLTVMSLVLFNVLIAYLTLRFYDEPVREKLKRIIKLL